MVRFVRRRQTPGRQRLVFYDFISFISEEILESFSSHPPFLFPTSDYLLDLEAEAPHPVVKKTLDNLKSSFGSSEDSQLSSSTTRNPQLQVQGPDSYSTSRHSTPASSVRSSPPASATASPRKLAQTFSSSDPTLNNVDPNRLSNRLKNHGKKFLQ
jgi:hypothetical protein